MRECSRGLYVKEKQQCKLNCDPIYLCWYNRALTQMQVNLIQWCVELKLFTFAAHRVTLERKEIDTGVLSTMFKPLCFPFFKHHLLIPSFYESYRVVIIPQTLWEVTDHMVDSRIQHRCH